LDVGFTIVWIVSPSKSRPWPTNYQTQN